MLQQALSHRLRSKDALRLKASVAPVSSVINCMAWSDKQGGRAYTQSSFLLQATAKQIRNKKAAQEYNRQKILYKKQVSILRKEYAEEVAAQRAADTAEKEAKRQEETRRRLERQRLKNIRSAQNAIRQKELREQRHLEWQEELKIAQANRDERNERFRKARQLLVDELEEEAPLWLTTPEEVEKAFTPDIDQRLWARPHSIIGAPAPSEDAEFWKYETHTWHMDKTYPTRAEVLIEEIQEKAFFKANIDEEFWTPERIAEQEELEKKAKLRAMVRDEGRRILLHKQRQLLQDDFSTKKKYELPKAMPVPSLQVLANAEAMEREGAEVLLNDPTKFFEFENDSHADSTAERMDNGASATYQGPTLGKPIGLKDPIRSPVNEGRPYPVVVGKLPKPDMRSEKEKKREEREQAMLAAARGESDKSQSEIEMEAEDSFETDNPLDYDVVSQEYDSDDDEDREKEIDSVISKLESEVAQLKEELHVELETVQQELKARKESGQGMQSTNSGVLDQYVKNEGVDEDGKGFVQYERSDEQKIGLDENAADINNKRKEFSRLTEEQVVAVLNLAVDGLGKGSMSKTEILDALKKVPGHLSDDQIARIATIVETERAQNEKLEDAFWVEDKSDGHEDR